jgi:hypothetical protein
VAQTVGNGSHDKTARDPDDDDAPDRVLRCQDADHEVDPPSRHPRMDENPITAESRLDRVTAIGVTPLLPPSVRATAKHPLKCLGDQEPHNQAADGPPD